MQWKSSSLLQYIGRTSVNSKLVNLGIRNISSCIYTLLAIWGQLAGDSIGNVGHNKFTRVQPNASLGLLLFISFKVDYVQPSGPLKDTPSWASWDAANISFSPFLTHTNCFQSNRPYSHSLPQAGRPLCWILSGPDPSPHVLPDHAGAQSRLDCGSICWGLVY